MIQIPEINALYVDVFKVASTSIKLALALATGRRVRFHWEVHGIADWLGEFGADYSSCFKFGFVRNPWDRLVSCWLSKFAHEKCDPILMHQQHDAGLFQGMTFDAFARRVCDIPDLEANAHIRQQACAFRGLGDVWIGRFENLQPGWQHVCNMLGIDLPLTIANATIREHYSSYYTAELTELVGQRYAVDVQAFGYHFERAA